MKTPQVETLQFMQQSLSRLVQSLFSLAVTLKQHVETTFFLPRARGEIMLMTSSLAKILLTKGTV